MRIIKNSEELKKLVNEHNDLILPGEDVRIEFEPIRDEIRNVECNNLFLMNDDRKFNFNGRNFKGRDFNGGDFNGWNFNGRNFNGRNFNGEDFNGRKFNGRDISYYAVFISYGNIKCTSIKGRRKNSFHKCLDGELTIEDKKHIITIDDKEIELSEESYQELKKQLN